MGKKGFVKGLAAGAVLGAVASLIMSMEKEERDEKMKAIKKAALEIKDNVAKHAKTLGKLSKQAYGKIVDTTVGEYRGMKLLSEEDLQDLKKELKGDWQRLQKILKKK